MENKIFTVKEANAALPRLSRLLTGVRDRWRFMSGHQRKPAYMLEEYHIVEEGPVSPDYFKALLAVRRSLREVERIGVQVKDIDTGLVDFPSRLYGRDVLLCWRLGEEEVRFWHDLEAGFTGRQPLPDPDTGSSDDEGH
ncbi:MAG: DUF2203 domain-containing protein [Candidatus Polarisedimenticolia bacterium]